MRTALVLSALTQRPLRVQNVRGGTSYPGLSQEDLSLIQALRQMTHAETVSAELGSHTVSFLPTTELSGPDLILPSFEEDSRHQNACVLMATLIPLFAQTGRYAKLIIEGETYGQNTLSFDAMVESTFLAFRRLGLYARCDLLQSGFGRGSAGRLEAEVEPSHLEGVTLKDRGTLLGVRAVVATTNLSPSIAERGEQHLRKLAHSAQVPLTIEVVSPEGIRSGAHVTVACEYEGGLGSSSVIGTKGVRIESVAQRAFEKTLQWMRSGAGLDEFLAEQIIVLACLASTPSQFTVDRITPRLTTTIWVIRQFMPIPIVVKGREGGPGQVSIRKG